MANVNPSLNDVFSQMRHYIDPKKIPTVVKSLDTALSNMNSVKKEEAQRVNQCVQDILSTLAMLAEAVEKKYAEAVRKIPPLHEEEARQPFDNARKKILTSLQPIVALLTKIKIKAARLQENKEKIVQVKAKPELPSAQETLYLKYLVSQLEQLLPEGPVLQANQKTALEDFLRKQAEENLHLLIPLVLHRTIQHSKKEHLIDVLESLYPQSKEYFSYESGQRLILPHGMEIAVAHLQKKGAISLPCEVFGDMLHLQERLLLLAKKGEKTVHTFLFANCAAELGRAHWAPLLFYPNDDGSEYRLVITNSIGTLESGSMLVGMLKQIGREITAKTNKPCKIFFFEQQRQRDSANCSLFALHDVVRFSKSRELIRSYFENLLAVYQNHPKDEAIALDTLPHHDFMRPTQSIKQIEKDFAQSVRYASQTRAKKLKEKRAKLDRADYRVVAVFNKSSRQIEMKKQNFFIARQAVKYDALIWKHIISEAQKS
jgi:hypothetical protein